MGGPGLERVWNGMERGLERNGTAAHLYQNWQFGARVAQQAILRLPAKHIPTITQQSR